MTSGRRYHALALLLVAGCWRDPEAIGSQFAAALVADAASEGVVVACDDDDPCTTDAYGKQGVCAHTPASGANCSAKKPCMVAPVCVAGTCTGPDRFWAHDLALSALRDQVSALALLPDGDGVAVGTVEVSGPGLGKARHAFALRFGQDGLAADGKPPAPLWLMQDAAHHHDVAGLVALDQHTLLAVGAHRELLDQPAGALPRSWAWFQRFSPTKGDLFNDKLLVDGNHEWREVAAAADGTLLAVGQLDSMGLLTRFDAAGARTWSHAMAPAGGPLQHGRFNDVQGLPGPTPRWLAVGHAADAGGVARSGWAVALAGPGTAVTWEQTYAPPQQDGAALYNVQPLPNGEAMLLGQLWDVPTGPGFGPSDSPWQSAGTAWLLRIAQSDGHLIAQRTIKLSGNPAGLAWQAGAKRLVTWQPGANDATDGALVFVDALANVVGQLPVPSRSYLGLVARPDDALLLYGFGPDGGGNCALAQADPWGATSCASSGGCATTAAASCDDGNPCTFDTCAPPVGCSHTPLSAGSFCPTGVCQGAQCMP